MSTNSKSQSTLSPTGEILDDLSQPLEGGDIKGDEPVIGIDLGTSNSAACMIVDGRPIIFELQPSQQRGRVGVRSVPSVVGFDKDSKSVVGVEALPGLLDDPERTIFSSKRFIGRPYDSLPVQKMLSRFPYKIIPGREGKVGVEINGRPVSLVNIAGRILKAVRDAATKIAGRPLTRAVITVPAFYNDNQRAAVIQAGRLAGLTVERILNEPTAAAIAYGVIRSTQRKLLVYDLGGGTFDVSVMDVTGDHLQVMSIDGDTFLGGNDFDARLVDLLCQKYQRQSGSALSRSPRAMALLMSACEGAKKRLSTHESTHIMLREAQLLGGGSARLEVEVVRSELEKISVPLVTQTLKICASALKSAGLARVDVAEVLLVGGQTRMPLVRKMVEQFFECGVRCELNPDEVVALGAGLYAHLPRAATTRFRDVLPLSIGIDVQGSFRILLQSNTPLPCLRQLRFKVPAKFFPQYKLDIWQGDSSELHQNEKLGILPVNLVAPGELENVPLRLDFSVSPDGLLRLTLNNESTGEAYHTLLNAMDETSGQKR